MKINEKEAGDEPFLNIVSVTSQLFNDVTQTERGTKISWLERVKMEDADAVNTTFRVHSFSRNWNAVKVQNGEKTTCSLQEHKYRG